MNIVLYMRMSTDKQDNSIESQEQVLEKYAQNNKLNIVKKYVDEGISGRTANKRPSFMQMIDDSYLKEFEAVLIYDSSRFARNLEESLVYKSALKKNGVRIISATEPTLDEDTSLITDAMMGAINELYSRKLSKSVKRGMIFGASKGNFQGPVPYGYKKKDGIVVFDEKESEVIKLIFNHYIETGTYYKVLKKLHELGIKTRNGNPWSSVTIRNVLNNPSYIGKIPYSGEIYDGNHPAIVDTKTFEKVTAIINSKDNRQSRPSSTYSHMLSGILKCSHCGGGLYYSTNGKYYKYFRCRNSSHFRNCTHTSMIGIKKAEILLFNLLEHLVSCDDVLDYKIFVKKDTSENSEKFLMDSLKKNELKFERIKNAYLNGIDSIEEYKLNKEKLNLEKEELLKNLKNDNVKNSTTVNFEEIKEKVRDLIIVLKSDEYDLSQKNDAIKSVINRIVFNKESNEFIAFFYF